MKTIGLLIGMVAVVVLASSFAVADVVFDESLQNSWTPKWDTEVNSLIPAYEGDNVLARQDYGNQLTLYHSGFVPSDGLILDFYVNTNAPAGGQLGLSVVVRRDVGCGRGEHPVR